MWVTPPAPIITLNGNAQPADGPVTDVPVTADGGYLLAVTAFDAAGNERRAERSFTITGGGCGLTDLEPSGRLSVDRRLRSTIRGRSGSAESVTIRVPIPGHLAGAVRRIHRRPRRRHLCRGWRSVAGHRRQRARDRVCTDAGELQRRRNPDHPPAARRATVPWS